MGGGATHRGAQCRRDRLGRTNIREPRQPHRGGQSRHHDRDCGHCRHHRRQHPVCADRLNRDDSHSRHPHQDIDGSHKGITQRRRRQSLHVIWSRSLALIRPHVHRHGVSWAYTHPAIGRERRKQFQHSRHCVPSKRRVADWAVSPQH